MTYRPIWHGSACLYELRFDAKKGKENERVNRELHGNFAMIFFICDLFVHT